MLRTYTPEERAERRRRSGERSAAANTALARAADREDSDSEASWIADLRSQGVDVNDFLKSASPLETVKISDSSEEEKNRRRSARRMSRAKKHNSRKSDVNEKAKQPFSQFLDTSYIVFDETVGGMGILSLEERIQNWEAEVEHDSKNYDPSGTAEEKIKKNKKWALEKALKRTAEAGYRKPAQDKPKDTDSTEKKIYPKVAPLEIEPLPPIDEKDLEILEPPLNPRELGIFPHRLPHKLIDLVPKVARSQVRIMDGVVVIDGTREEGLKSCGSDAIIVSCINDQCTAYVQCSREASLVRCEKCNTVSPVCPGLSESQGRKSKDGRHSLRVSRSDLHSSTRAVRGYSDEAVRRSTSDLAHTSYHRGHDFAQKLTQLE